jgi:hypothetical protein
MATITKKDRTDIENSIRTNLVPIVLKAGESGWGDYIEQEEEGELNGILPANITSMINSIDVPRHRDGEWGDEMDVNLVDDSCLTIKLSQAEMDLCKKTFDDDVDARIAANEAIQKNCQRIGMNTILNGNEICD